MFDRNKMPNGTDQSKDLLERKLTVWEKTIDVQIHFNDLELRIRNYAITILAAVLTGSALTLKDNISVDLFARRISVAVLIIFSGLIVWLAFYTMDALWYHRLLLGAVEHGKKVEEALKAELSEIGLTEAIGARKPRGVGLSSGESKVRMHVFYLGIALTLFGLAVTLYCGRTTIIGSNMSASLVAPTPIASTSPGHDFAGNVRRP